LLQKNNLIKLGRIISFKFLFLPFLIFNSCILYTQLQSPLKPKKFVQISDNFEKDKVKFYWIGHATVLIQLFDKWIITDPNFSTRTGVVVKRFVEQALDLEKIKPIDIVLISHNHFDHLDQPSLRKLKNSKEIFFPVEGKAYIPEKIFLKETPVSENGWETYNSNDVLITPVPVQHFGGRWLIDNLWDGEPYTGYIIRYKGYTVFFAGDTGYNEKKFKAIGDAFQIDVSLIPVGPVSYLTNSSLGNSVHVNPYGAIQIFKDTKSKYMIPIHHSTFYRRGGNEMEMLLDSVKKSNSQERIFILEQGECVEWKESIAKICN
jgi:L-ascorbate metabolism protein UlaG (beta-lactamase superfamily)